MRILNMCGCVLAITFYEAVRFRVSEKGTGFLGYWVPFNSVFLQGTGFQGT